ncbi:DUF742 domain-containing protein [Streptomyces sp. NPDC056672]|uniref:DUF742 domain-containing protein n=1 Tax=Streptomyces sp. NPDC056672 TaxID=3345906 RepID=UPI0036BCED64
MTAQETAGPGTWAGGLRPYAVTGGRTSPRHELRLESELVAGSRSPERPLGVEAQAVVALCRERPRPVVEIAGIVRQSVLVTKIVVSDLLDSGALEIALPADIEPDHPNVLEAVLVGLRNRFGDAKSA